MLPPQGAVSRKRRQDALGTLDIHIAGLGIDGRARGGVAQVDCVAEVIVVEMLPKLPARFGVKASYSLLQVRPLSRVTHRVHLPVGNHGRRLTGKISPPKQGLGLNT